MSGEQDVPVEVERETDMESGGDNHGKENNKTSDDHLKNEWNRYKKFNKEKRKQVILGCKLTMFTVAASICVASFTVPALRKAQPRGIAMWQWSLLATVLLGGPLVSEGIVKIVDCIFMKCITAGKEDVLYYVLGLVESAWIVMWFTMVLIAWLFVKDDPSYLNLPQSDIIKFKLTVRIINITLIAMILGSILWILKNLLLLKAESSFHIKRFFDRIRVAVMKRIIIQVLSFAYNASTDGISIEIILFDRKRHGSSKFLTRTTTDVANNKRLLVIDISFLCDVTQQNVSCWGMEQVIKWVTESKYLIYGYYTEDNKSNKLKIKSEKEASELATKLFRWLSSTEASENSRIIHKKVLQKYLPHHILVEYLLDKAKSIDEEFFNKWMMKAQREHSSLILALLANKRLFEALNRFINALLILLIIALWLLMLRYETRQFIIYFGVAIVGAAFLYGDTCKKMLENLLFVFLVHPYDIGDCCVIEDTPVTIREVNVLSTTALTFANELRIYSNAQLASQTIGNYTRSKQQMGDFIEFVLQAKTHEKTIDELQQKVRSYITATPNYWDPEHHWEMEFGDFDNMDKIKMKLNFLHTINYHDIKERQTRKYELASRIKTILNNLKLPDGNVEDDSNFRGVNVLK